MIAMVCGNCQTQTSGHPALHGLDAAWAEAVAALPGGDFGGLSVTGWPCGKPDCALDWNARVLGANNETYVEVLAPTPAAALRALAAKLRERAG